MSTGADCYNALVLLRGLWRKFHKDTDCGKNDSLHCAECYATNEILQINGMINSDGTDAEFLTPEAGLLKELFDGHDIYEADLEKIVSIIRAANAISYEEDSLIDDKENGKLCVSMLQAIKPFIDSVGAYRIALCFADILRITNDISPDPHDAFNYESVMAQVLHEYKIARSSLLAP